MAEGFQPVEYLEVFRRGQARGVGELEGMAFRIIPSLCGVGWIPFKKKIRELLQWGVRFAHYQAWERHRLRHHLWADIDDAWTHDQQQMLLWAQDDMRKRILNRRWPGLTKEKPAAQAQTPAEPKPEGK